jgi:hypothetical protein
MQYQKTYELTGVTIQTSPIVSSYNSAGKQIYASYPDTLH